MPPRTTEQTDQARRDLLHTLTEADGPRTLHQIARDAWDGMTPWPAHLHQTWGDLDALRRTGTLAASGALYPGATTTLWGLTDSPFGDSCSDAREVQRLMTGWEPAE